MSSWCVRSMDIPFQLYTSSRTTPPSPKMTTPTPPPTLSPSPTLDHMMEVCTHVLRTMESLTTLLVMNWYTAVYFPRNTTPPQGISLSKTRVWQEKCCEKKFSNRYYKFYACSSTIHWSHHFIIASVAAEG